MKQDTNSEEKREKRKEKKTDRQTLKRQSSKSSTSDSDVDPPGFGFTTVAPHTLKKHSIKGINLMVNDDSL